MAITPLMNLDLPTVGTLGTQGPDWAEMLNAALEQVDEHDHTEGKGKQVPIAGLLIDDDIDLDGNNVISLRTVRFTAQADELEETTDKNCFYSVNGNLYWNNASGAAVQITDDTGLNLTSIGSIGGDFSTSDASVTYSDTSKSFLFKQDADKTADIAAGSLFVYENIAGAKYTKIKTTASQASDQTITLPAALPASTKIMTLSSTGVIAATYDIDGTTIELNSTTLRVKDAGITTAKLANANVTTAKIADLNVTTAKLADACITQVKKAISTMSSSTAGAGDIAVSASSGNFTTSSTSYVDVTNLSVTLTTLGGPVFLGLVPTTSACNVGVTSNSSQTSAEASFRFLEGANSLATPRFIAGGASGTLSNSAPPSSLSMWIPLAAGTYTFKLQAKATNGNALVFNSQLMAYEK